MTVPRTFDQTPSDSHTLDGLTQRPQQKQKLQLPTPHSVPLTSSPSSTLSDPWMKWGFWLPFFFNECSFGDPWPMPHPEDSCHSWGCSRRNQCFWDSDVVQRHTVVFLPVGTVLCLPKGGPSVQALRETRLGPSADVKGDVVNGSQISASSTADGPLRRPQGSPSTLSGHDDERCLDAALCSGARRLTAPRTRAKCPWLPASTNTY